MGALIFIGIVLIICFILYLSGKIAERKDASEKIESLERSLANYEKAASESTRNKRNFETAQSEANTLREKNANLTFIIEDLRLKHDYLIDKLKYKESNFESEKKQLLDKIDSLQQEVDNYRLRKTSQSKPDYSSEKKINSLQNQILELELELDAVYNKNYQLISENSSQEQIISIKKDISNLQSENKILSDHNEKLQNNIISLQKENNNLRSENNTLSTRNESLQTHIKEIMLERQFSDTASELKLTTMQGVKKIAKGLYNIRDYYSSIENHRLLNAFNTPLSILSYSNISADILSSDSTYNGVTLTECTCEDFRRRHKPCKHMLYLAYSLGLLDLNREQNEKEYQYSIVKVNNCFAELKQLNDDKKKEQEKIKKAKQQVTKLAKEQKAAEKIKQEYLQEIDSIIEEKCNGYQQLAAIMADLQTLYIEKISAYLLSKPNKAKKAALEIRELRKVYRASLEEKKVLEYKLSYIESMFPNINDIFDSGFAEEQEHFVLETKENTDPVRFFVSDEDYHALSVTAKNQLALDRYIEGRKSNWQIGRDYEMYIGYHCASLGYHVTYTGIIQKLEDMGRDLIAKKGDKTYIIQCKRWSKEKTIHEKHIFQLFGTVILYNIDHPKHPALGVFVSTTQLSKKAQKIAEELNIQVLLVDAGDFPRIKCNINRNTGEKIYHLPFDQQYDSVVIDEFEGECYALTVKEAEEKGFRRAFKHFAS